MAERFMSVPKSKGKSDSETGLSMMTGEADDDGVQDYG